MSETATSLGFYQDFELYRREGGYASQLTGELPDVTSISAFPTSHIGAYMQSFTPSINECSIDASSYSFNDFAGSMDSYSSIRFSELPTVENSPTTPIEPLETEQVNLFWERYNEYPQYLKKLKRKNRRRAKRQAGPAPV